MQREKGGAEFDVIYKKKSSEIRQNMISTHFGYFYSMENLVKFVFKCIFAEIYKKLLCRT